MIGFSPFFCEAARVRALFEGGLSPVSEIFLVLLEPDRAAESSPSSVEASPDESCWRSVVDALAKLAATSVGRLRLAALPPVDDGGEDMSSATREIRAILMFGVVLG